MMLLFAEVQKTLRRPFDVVLTLAVIVLSILSPLIVMARALREPGRAAMYAVQLTWPFSFDRATLVLILISMLGAPMLAASAMGSEHDTRTWATLVSRRPTRYPLLLAKVVVMLGAVAVMTVLAVMTAVMTAAVAAAIVGVAPDPVVTARQVNELGTPLSELALAIAEGWWSALMALMAAVFIRSTLAAALLGILIPQLLRAALSEETAFLNPAAHLLNLRQVAWNLTAPLGFDVGVGVWGSAGVLLLYAVAVVAATAYWFEKRDIPVS